MHRRKTILNNLKNSNLSYLRNLNIEKLLEKVGISKNLRAEALDAKKFALLFQEIKKNHET